MLIAVRDTIIMCAAVLRFGSMLAVSTAKGSGGVLGDTPELVRDAKISKLAQYGAEKLVERFPKMLDDSYSGYFISLIDPYSGYRELSMCGSAPLTIEDIGTAHRETPGLSRSIGDIHCSSNYALLSGEQPLIGVGNAEADGLACSYALVRSANYPFR